MGEILTLSLGWCKVAMTEEYRRFHERWISILKFKEQRSQCTENNALNMDPEILAEVKEIKASMNSFIHPGKGGRRKGAGRPKTDKWKRLAKKYRDTFTHVSRVPLSLTWARSKQFFEGNINNSANFNELIAALEAQDKDKEYLRFTSNDDLYVDEAGVASIAQSKAGHTLYARKRTAAWAQYTYRTEHQGRNGNRGYDRRLRTMARNQELLLEEEKERERGGS
jgi:hypothetical protein